MRYVMFVVVAACVAAPAFASGHGHTTYKPASETIPRAPKTKSDEAKPYREKKTRYEKELKNTERESGQVRVYKMKGLTHPAFEAGDLTATGKGTREVDGREAPAPKLRPNGTAAVGAPSAHGVASGAPAGSSGAGH